MKEKLPLLIAIVFGIIAFVGISRYLQNQRQEIPTSQIVVTRNAMSKGQRISSDDIVAMEVDRAVVSRLSGIYTPAQRTLLVDQILDKDMKAQEPILESSLALPESGPSYERFSMKLEPGERAISLPIDNAGSVSNFIRVNDRVDILANIPVPETTVQTFTIPNQGVQEMTETNWEPTTIFLFEDVKVLAVGSMYEEPEPGERLGGTGGTVTIAATPREAQVLAWAMRNGGGQRGGGGDVTFTLLLRPPQDRATVYPRELVNYEDLLDMTNIQELQQLRLDQQEGPEVEEYQGGIPQDQ